MQIAEFLEFSLLSGGFLLRSRVVEEYKQVAIDLAQAKDLRGNGSDPRRLSVLTTYSRIHVWGP